MDGLFVMAQAVETDTFVVPGSYIARFKLQDFVITADGLFVTA